MLGQPSPKTSVCHNTTSGLWKATHMRQGLLNLGRAHCGTTGALEGPVTGLMHGGMQWRHCSFIAPTWLVGGVLGIDGRGERRHLPLGLGAEQGNGGGTMGGNRRRSPNERHSQKMMAVGSAEDCCVFGIDRQCGFTFTARRSEDDAISSFGGCAMQSGPMCQRPFLFRLAGGDVADDRVFVRKNFFCSVGERRIGMDSCFERSRRRNLPAGQKANQPRGFVQRFRPRRDAIGVAQFPAEKSAALVPTEPAARPGEKTQDRAPVVAGEIHRAVKLLTAQRANERPGLAQARAATPARHRPDAGERRQALQQRGDFFRHEQMKFARRENVRARRGGRA